MPIYEYRCERGHTFEVMQRMTDDPVSSCSTCAAPVQRVFHPVAVHFKGSGFYSTDYGKQKKGVAASETGESKSDSKGPDSKGSDSKGTDSKGSASKESGSSKQSSSSPSSSSSSSSSKD